MAYLTPAMQELRAALTEADKISQRSSLDAASSARLSFLLAKIKTLNSNSLPTSGEETRAFFRALLTNKEVRADVPMQEGSQSITHTEGVLGGYIVPTEFHNEVIQGMAQFDPLLDENVVTLIQSADFSLRPYNVPGWDLSTFSAVKVAEAAQQIASGMTSGGTLPAVSGKMIGSYKYKASIPVSTELEEDAFQPMMKTISDAYQVGFARGIGEDLVTGNGTTSPQGVLNAAGASVYTTANTGKLVLDDFESVYFSINRFHRANPKCAWLMNDAAYQMCRKSIDTVGNPLLKVIHDKETIMGKPVLISPSLPEYNASLGTQSAGSFCVFGNLSALFVRVSQTVIRRQWQLPGYVENGLALYTGYLRADAKLVDPTNGAVAPFVAASLKA